MRSSLPREMILTHWTPLGTYPHRNPLLVTWNVWQSPPVSIMIRSLTSPAPYVFCVWLLVAQVASEASGQNNNASNQGANADAAASSSGAVTGQQPLQPLQPLPQSELRPLPFDPYESFVDAPPNYLGPVYPSTSCPPVRRNRYRGFIEYLYLQPGSVARTGYAMPVNGPVLPPTTPPVPMGATAFVDPGYSSGVRLGFGIEVDPCRPGDEWSLAYSYFKNTTSSSISIDPLDSIVIDSLVIHPSTTAADKVYLDASGNGNVEFHLLDVDRKTNVTNCGYTLDYILGLRFANMKQHFDSRFVNSTTVEDVDTSIKYDGAGFKLGVNGQLHSTRNGLRIYGRSSATFLAGRFHSSYTQTDSFSGVVVHSTRNDDSIVPVLDLEMGLGWASRNDRWQIQLGYLFNAWYNVIGNENFINSVQNAQAGDVRDTLTFDGLVTRAEFRF